MLSLQRARFLGFAGSTVTLVMPAKAPRTLPERIFCDIPDADIEFNTVLRFECFDDVRLQQRQYCVSCSAKTLPFVLHRLCTFSLMLKETGAAEAPPSYALAARPVFSGYAYNTASLQDAAQLTGEDADAAAFLLVADRAVLALDSLDLLLFVSRYIRARVLLCLSSRFPARFDAVLRWLLRILMQTPALLFLYGLSGSAGFVRAAADFGTALPDMDIARWKALRTDAMALETQLDAMLGYFVTATADTTTLVLALMQHAHARLASYPGGLLLSSQQAAAQWLPSFFAWKCRARFPLDMVQIDRPADALASRDVLFVELPFPFALCRPLLRGDYAQLLLNASIRLGPGRAVTESDAPDALPLIVLEGLEWWTPRELLLALQPFMRRGADDPLALSTVKLLVFSTTPCYADDDGALFVSRGALAAAAPSHRVSLADSYADAVDKVIDLGALPAAKTDLLRWAWRNVHFPPTQRLAFFFSNILPSRQRPLCLELVAMHAVQDVACFSSAMEGLSVWRTRVSPRHADARRAALVLSGEQLYFARLLALLCFFERVAVVMDDGATPPR